MLRQVNPLMRQPVLFRAPTRQIQRLAPHIARGNNVVQGIPTRALVRPTLVSNIPIQPLTVSSLALSRTYATSPTKPPSDPKSDPRQKKLDPSLASEVQRPRDSSADSQGVISSARQEASGVARGFAEFIAGSSPEAAAAGARETKHHGSVTEDFWAFTNSIITSVPKPALYTGIAGTLPYVGLSTGTVLLAREASLISQGAPGWTGLDLPTVLANLDTLEHVQITYGAIILSFLGAIHWGFEFARHGGEQGYRRLALGVVPVLYAWPTTFLPHAVALAAQWAGFTGMWFADLRATSNGWTTSWYGTYRFYLSIIVGFSIIATWTGTSYYGAGAGAATTTDTNLPAGKHRHTTERVSSTARLERVKEETAPDDGGKREGKVGGAVAVDEGTEAYGKVRNIEREEEQKREAEEEKKRKEQEEEQQQQQQGKKEDDQNKDSKTDGDGESEGSEGDKTEQEATDRDKEKEDKPADQKKNKEVANKDGKKDDRKDSDKDGKGDKDVEEAVKKESKKQKK